ncbi:MAG: adenosine deaminase, partial [Gammaproteobacteria bacterium]|nr:adenosine deaminase [Gammaproteobacteria bacterium]
ASCDKDHNLNAAIQDSQFYEAIIDAWSMRHFKRGMETGHDHFFNSFKKFHAITSIHRGEALADIVARSALQNEVYLELMIHTDVTLTAQKLLLMAWNNDFESMYQKILAADMSDVVKQLSLKLDTQETQMQEILACNSVQAHIGCKLPVRYIYQVARENTPLLVFGQMVAGFEFANHDKRVVAINLVQPEDGLIAMRDYRLHMEMIAFLRKKYPNIKLTLHAGELSEATVNREDLKTHITDAVRIANADRIGHGVDILFEDNATSLLKEMAHKKVLVEVNLSSNQFILDVSGPHHPLLHYLNHGVPIALSTDDEGISRSDLTQEFQLATVTYDLTYPIIKTMVRNSLTYAFLPGESLWQEGLVHRYHSACSQDVPETKQLSPQCQAFLSRSEKATLQWELEKRFTIFEHSLRG